MIVIRFLLKILLAPVMLVITALPFVLGVFLALSKSVLSIVSSLFMFLALLLFLSGNWQNGFIMVGIAWAVSPSFSAKYATSRATFSRASRV